MLYFITITLLPQISAAKDFFLFPFTTSHPLKLSLKHCSMDSNASGIIQRQPALVYSRVQWLLTMATISAMSLLGAKMKLQLKGSIQTSQKYRCPKHISISIFFLCTYNQILIKPMGPPGTATLNYKFSTDNASSWEYLRTRKSFLKFLIKIGFKT